jgi:ferric-dicitrate binding protein FerR (iron transport regulator)
LRNNFDIILARSGDLVAVAAQFEAALKANPSHQTARRNLEAVRKQAGKALKSDKARSVTGTLRPAASSRSSQWPAGSM